MLGNHLKLTAALFLAAASSRANATVDAYLNVTVPYYELQSGDLCMRTFPILASFGIPGASAMQGTLARTQVYVQETGGFTNINLVATNPVMKGVYVNDSVSAGNVMTYEMKLDVAALSKSNGTTRTGRTATVTAAKLFLLAMADNMAHLSPRGWRLRVEFVGLPSQTGLPGTLLNATTVYAYSPTSPLLASYRKELLNQAGSCPTP